MIWKHEVKKLLKNPMIWFLLCFCLLFNTLLMLEHMIDSPYIRQQAQEIREGSMDAATIKNFVASFDSLDMNEVKELKEELYNYQPEGIFKNFIDANYDRLNQRLQEIRKNEEMDDLFFPADIYQMHSRLYVKLFRPLLLEMAMMVILSILFLMDYERIHKTTDIIYSSYKGRSVQKTKWFCGMVVGFGFSFLLILITLSSWFLCVPYKGFWNTSISSVFVMEPRGIFYYPFITYQSMTVLEYLLATICFSYILLVIVGILIGVIQLILKNSYFSVLAVVLLSLGCMYMNTISFGNWLDLILSWNFAYLWQCSGFWFMERNLYDSFQGADMLNIGIQVVILCFLWKFTYKKYQVKDCL